MDGNILQMGRARFSVNKQLFCFLLSAPISHIYNKCFT